MTTYRQLLAQQSLESQKRIADKIQALKQQLARTQLPNGIANAPPEQK